MYSSSYKYLQSWVNQGPPGRVCFGNAGHSNLNWRLQSGQRSDACRQRRRQSPWKTCWQGVIRAKRIGHKHTAHTSSCSSSSSWVAKRYRASMDQCCCKVAISSPCKSLRRNQTHVYSVYADSFHWPFIENAPFKLRGRNQSVARVVLRTNHL